MSNDYEIYDGMNLSDLFKKIDNNTKRNKSDEVSGEKIVCIQTFKNLKTSLL